MRDLMNKGDPATNKLATQTKILLHMWNTLKDTPSTELPTSFLFTLFNPVQRIVEVYRHSHPQNCHKDKGPTSSQSLGCWLLDRNRFAQPGGPGHRLFVECFPNPAMEEFAQALLPPYPQEAACNLQGKTDQELQQCRQVARDAGNGKTKILAFCHIGNTIINTGPTIRFGNSPARKCLD